jgi:hypothetical protein
LARTPRLTSLTGGSWFGKASWWTEWYGWTSEHPSEPSVVNFSRQRDNRQYVVCAKTSKGAAEEFDKTLSNRDEDLDFESGAVTVGEYVTRWFEDSAKGDLARVPTATTSFRTDGTSFRRAGGGSTPTRTRKLYTRRSFGAILPLQHPTSTPYYTAR